MISRSLGVRCGLLLVLGIMGCGRLLDFDEIQFRDAGSSGRPTDAGLGGAAGTSGQTCAPLAKTCEAGDVVRCNAAGTAWVVFEACAHGCLEGACQACVTDCAGRACGDDGCGESCGTCAGALETCVEGACVCQSDCSGRACGDDGCGVSCGTCAGAQEACVEGACVCQPDCLGKQCGGDRCGGSCGQCNTTSHFCNASQKCEACESAECGICDEIDVSLIEHYEGQIGADHNQPGDSSWLRAEVFTWPITTELQIDTSGSSPCFALRHLDGQPLWATSHNNLPQAASMVLCWHSNSLSADGSGGLRCKQADWYTPGGITCKGIKWDENKPVAHVFISAVEKKRTNIRYFPNWPYFPLPATAGVDPNDIGTDLHKRDCR